MTLVGTSVLIDFFKGNKNENVKKFEWVCSILSVKNRA